MADKLVPYRDSQETQIAILQEEVATLQRALNRVPMKRRYLQIVQHIGASAAFYGAWVGLWDWLMLPSAFCDQTKNMASLPSDWNHPIIWTITIGLNLLWLAIRERTNRASKDREDTADF